MFTFSQMTQSGFSACKAAERGDAVVSLSEANTADGNSGKPFGEMWTLEVLLSGEGKTHGLWFAASRSSPSKMSCSFTALLPLESNSVLIALSNFCSNERMHSGNPFSILSWNSSSSRFFRKFHASSWFLHVELIPMAVSTFAARYPLPESKGQAI